MEYFTGDILSDIHTQAHFTVYHYTYSMFYHYLTLITTLIETYDRFLVHLLKYEENEAQNNIPYIERSIIDRIHRWTFIASKDGPSRHA